MKRYPFNPDYAVPTGATLAEVMKDRNLTLKRLSWMTRVEESLLQGILDGEGVVTPEIAQRLEEAFGTPAAFWLKRDATYWAKKRELAGACTPLPRESH